MSIHLFNYWTFTFIALLYFCSSLRLQSIWDKSCNKHDICLKLPNFMGPSSQIRVPKIVLPKTKIWAL